MNVAPGQKKNGLAATEVIDLLNKQQLLRSPMSVSEKGASRNTISMSIAFA